MEVDQFQTEVQQQSISSGNYVKELLNFRLELNPMNIYIILVGTYMMVSRRAFHSGQLRTASNHEFVRLSLECAAAILQKINKN